MSKIDRSVASLETLAAIPSNRQSPKPGPQSTGSSTTGEHSQGNSGHQKAPEKDTVSLGTKSIPADGYRNALARYASSIPSSPPSSRAGVVHAYLALATECVETIMSEYG